MTAAEIQALEAAREDAINKIVYGLYGLTKDQIKIIET